jgi:tetratricopeptide (TPR) repeat protein
MHRQFCCCLLLLLSIFTLERNALAQRTELDRDSWTTTPGTVEIAGQVRFSENVKQGTNVIVRLERFGGVHLDQMMIDNRGKFRFANLPRGQYVVTVSSHCFQAPQQQAELVHIFKAYLMFELRPDRSSPDCKQGDDATRGGIVDARVPSTAAKEFESGRAALRQKKLKEGIDHLQKAIGQYPDYFEAHLLLGTTYMEAREWDSAAHTLSRALQLNPDSALALFSLGEVRRHQKRYSDAEALLLSGLKLDDSSWQGHFTLGRVYLERDEFMKAAPHIGRTLQLKPELAEGHLLAGNIFLRVNQQVRALAEYEEYLRLAPNGKFASQARELIRKLKAARN